MHGDNQGGSLRHMCKILFQPFERFLIDVSHVKVIPAQVKDIVQHHVMHLPPIEGVVVGTETSLIRLRRGLSGSSSILEIMVARYTVERDGGTTQLLDVKRV